MATPYTPQLKDIQLANQKLKGIAIHTPLQKNINYSEALESHILFKREDLQVVRSYKIRGAYNKISNLPKTSLKNGIVCASAGNHAQGVAYSCNLLSIKGIIFMPSPTPKQKTRQVKMFGKDQVDIILKGDTYDDAFGEAMKYTDKNDAEFIHPFDDPEIIEGQGTVGLEILQDSHDPIDYLFIPVGGGGLAAGVGSVFKNLSPNTKIIGVEPEG
ncbi:MAG: pyridoxal-phosphate dependent enzyme, partial [Bacteroidota bacterium]